MIRVMSIEKDKIIEKDSLDGINFKKDGGVINWVDFERPSDEDVKLLSDFFKFHPLSIEDCLHRFQRAKIDDYNDYYFIVFNVAKGINSKRQIVFSELYIYVSKNYIVTLHYENLEIIDKVKGRIKGSSPLNEGVDFILYNLFDAIVDEYFPVLDRIGDGIDRVEDIILKYPGKRIENEIILLKKNMLKTKRVISPQREIINTLLRFDIPVVSEKRRMYFMDVYDHILRLYDLIDNYHDLLSGSMDLYMTQISNRMNAVMKVLTIITTIMMPLSLISGIYGMNFRFMPFLESPWGFYGSLGFMIIITIVEIIYFKKKDWFN